MRKSIDRIRFVFFVVVSFFSSFSVFHSSRRFECSIALEFITHPHSHRRVYVLQFFVCDFSSSICELYAVNINVNLSDFPYFRIPWVRCSNFTDFIIREIENGISLCIYVWSKVDNDQKSANKCYFEWTCTGEKWKWSKPENVSRIE